MVEVKMRLTTTIIFGVVIFLASLFSGWLTQSRELASLRAEQTDALKKVEINSNRITIMEQCAIAMKQDLEEIKGDVKDIRKDQVDFYKKIRKTF